MRWILALLLTACGDDDQRAAAPDLGAHSCSGATTPANIACCPNDLPVHGGCGAGDQCYAFEIACQCVGGQWCCQEGGRPIHGCSSLDQCYLDCGQDLPCRDDCDQSANQHTLDLYQALADCVVANCSTDGGAQSCLTGVCSAAWDACLADHPMCWF